MFNFSWAFRGVNTAFLKKNVDISLISPTSDQSDFLLRRTVRTVTEILLKVALNTITIWIKNWDVTVFEIRLSNLLARKLQNYNIYIDSIEKIWQKSLVRINFHWPWAAEPLLKSMIDVIKWKRKKIVERISIAHKYITTHFPGLIQALQ